MDIIVSIKQVPDTNDVKIDEKKGTLIREGVPSIINPDDKHALEAAIALKERYGGKITVLTMGPPQADDALRESLAMGADEAILLSDRKFAGADTWATAYSLSQAIKKIGGYDLVIMGRQAIDGDTAQVGPQVAESLELPQITYVKDIELIDDRIKVHRALEDGYEVLESPLPALITCIGALNDPRYPSIRGIVEAYRKHEVKVWSADDVDAEPEKIGLKGSPTQVKKTFVLVPKREGEMIEGTSKESAQTVVERLRDKNLVG